MAEPGRTSPRPCAGLRRPSTAATLIAALLALAALLPVPAARAETTGALRAPAAAMPVCRAGRPRAGCVVDGDTVWWRGRKIRLVATDAPETASPACPAERVAGFAARDRLAGLLGRGFTLHSTGRQDRYGRLLARLVGVDGRDVEAVLVAEGLSLPYVPGRVARERRTAFWCGRRP